MAQTLSVAVFLRSSLARTLRSTRVEEEEEEEEEEELDLRLETRVDARDPFLVSKKDQTGAKPKSRTLFAVLRLPRQPNRL